MVLKKKKIEVKKGGILRNGPEKKKYERLKKQTTIVG